LLESGICTEAKRMVVRSSKMREAEKSSLKDKNIK
jgi:hypothetical protein